MVVICIFILFGCFFLILDIYNFWEIVGCLVVLGLYFKFYEVIFLIIFKYMFYFEDIYIIWMCFYCL